MCTIEALLACFSLSGFYIDAAVIHRDEGRGELVQVVTEQKQPRHDKIYYPPKITYTIDRTANNPYSTLSFGYSLSMGKFTARLEASREFTDSINSASLGVTWLPFSR